VQRRATSNALVALLVSVMLLAGAKPASAAPCRHSDVLPSMSNLGQVRSAVRCLLNRERTRRGLPKLKPKGALAKAAQKHGDNMVRKRFFSHVAPNGSTPQSRIRIAGYWGDYLGENLAWGLEGYATPRQMVFNWMHSRRHRRNILDRRFRDGGVGIAIGDPRGGPGATYATTFGGRRSRVGRTFG